MFCREQAARLGERLDEIEATGAQLVAIGNGQTYWAEAFIEEEEIDYPVYVDPGRRAYEYFGMKRSMLGVLAPKSVVHSVRAMSAGHFQSQTRGDALQNGGVVVVNAEGEIIYEHIEREAGDLADLDEVLAVLEASAAG